METDVQNSTLAFLQGGGEMGRLTRNYQWHQTALGTPETWPQSLRSTISIILSSRFPMFLFWGPEHICFYNDAYRPSLGATGKHPYALGKPAADIWPETWPLIKPQIEQVLNGGEATWHQNQLIPIFRNGSLDDAYWTYSYSPVQNEEGKVAGVFVTLIETTDTVLATKKSEASENRFKNLIREATVGMVVLSGPEMYVSVVNEAYAKIIGRSAADLQDKLLFDIIPEAKEYFWGILDGVRTSGEAVYLYDQVYTVFDDVGKPITGYLNIVYQPYKEPDGAISGVLALHQDVTEQVLAREKIRESELSLSLAVDIGELGVYKVDAASRMATLSPRVQSWFGLPSATVPLAEVLAKVHPDDAAAVNTIFNDSFERKEGGYHDIVYRIVNPQTDYVMYLRSTGQLQKQDDKPAYITGVLQDTTRQVLANKERLAAVFEAAQTSMFTFSPVRNAASEIIDFRFVITNPSFAAYVGQKPEVLNGALGSVWFPGYLTNGVFDMYRHTYLTGETQRREIHYSVDGHDLYLDLMSSKVGDEVLVSFNDFTALKKAQLLLQHANQYLQDIINKFETAICALKPVYQDNTIVDFQFTMTNSAYSAYSQLSPEEAKGKNVSDVFPQWRQTDSFNAYINVYNTGEPVSWEQHYNVDGLDVHLVTAASKMRDEVVVNFLNVSNLRNLQISLQRKVEDLEYSNQNLQEFAYAASHDLKEPVRKIHFFANKLKSSLGPQLSPESAKDFVRLETAAKRMHALIEDLLTYSQVSVQHTIFKPVDLNEVVQSVLGDLELVIAEKKAVIQVDELRVIEGHQRQIQQAFQNLISNAIKFHKKDEPPVLSITCRDVTGSDVPLSMSLEEQRRKFHLIEIKDNGIGFAQGDSDRIFNVFARLHSVTEYAGTGIGLSIVRKVAENHGGFVLAQSELGKGSVFSLFFPFRTEGQ